MNPPYSLITITIILSIFYCRTYILTKLKIIKLTAYRKIWNSLLLITFFVMGILGIILVIQVNYKLGSSWKWVGEKWGLIVLASAWYKPLLALDASSESGIMSQCEPIDGIAGCGTNTASLVSVRVRRSRVSSETRSPGSSPLAAAKKFCRRSPRRRTTHRDRQRRCRMCRVRRRRCSRSSTGQARARAWTRFEAGVWRMDSCVLLRFRLIVLDNWCGRNFTMSWTVIGNLWSCPAAPTSVMPSAPSSPKQTCFLGWH